MNITILTDNEKSWFIPFGKVLQQKLESLGHSVKYVFNKEEIENGDICFLLSCSRVIEENYLSRNKNNIVIHASDLPKGKGFSPLQWQILEGKNEIVVTLFEATKGLDAGPFYLKEKIFFTGNELYPELREKLGQKIIEMAIKFIINKENLTPQEQVGEETFYRKRKEEDDEIDPYKSIAEQFDHFRIANNDENPLWFSFRNRKYILKIYPKE